MWAWYHTRGEIGRFAQLGYTLRLLEDSGLLKRAPDAETTYRLIRVLDDPQLFNRLSGVQLRLGYGAGYELAKDADGRPFAAMVSTIEYHKPLSLTRQLDTQLRFFVNHISEPINFALQLQADHNWYFYTRAYDPMGANRHFGKHRCEQPAKRRVQ